MKRIRTFRELDGLPVGSLLSIVWAGRRDIAVVIEHLEPGTSLGTLLLVRGHVPNSQSSVRWHLVWAQNFISRTVIRRIA